MRGPDADDYRLDQIADICRWYEAGPHSAHREAVALAELAHVAADRIDLLARHAGQALASGDSDPDAALHRAVQLCITAGADMILIERWHSAAARAGRGRPGTSGPES